MAIKIAILSYINKLEDYSKDAKKNLILEGRMLADAMSDAAPLGITGALKDSFRVQIYEGVLKTSVSVVSNIEYAEKQDKDKLRHVPRKDLGKKSFRHYGRGVKKKRGETKGRFAVNYEAGWKRAKRGEVPSEIYATKYVETALTARGGVKGIKNRIFVKKLSYFF